MPVATFAPVYTASKWSTLLEGMRDTFVRRKKPMTNGEAVAFVREWKDVSSSPSTLWAQFAASAYGYNPPTSDVLRLTPQQRDARYRLEPDVWKWAGGIATELDERTDQPPPRISVNKETFTDPTFYGAVAAQLKEDGAKQPVRVPPSTKRPTAKRVGDSSSTMLLVLGALWLLTRKTRRGRRG